MKKCKICGFPISKKLKEGTLQEYKHGLCYDCYLLFKKRRKIKLIYYLVAIIWTLIVSIIFILMALGVIKWT